MKNRIGNSKGVTLIALVITIIVLLILASVATYSGVGVIRSSQFTTFITELKIMQTQVNDLYDQWKNENIKIDDTNGTITNASDNITIGKDLTYNLTVQDQANTVLVEELGLASSINDLYDYKYFDQETLQNLKIEGITREFFINIKTRNVVSYEGYTYEGVTYYTLEQVPQGLYNVDYDPQQAGDPTFDVSYEEIGENKWRVTVSNIQYDGYIDKWYVKYQEDGANYWNSTEDMSFVVSKSWIYNIKIVNGNVESESQQLFINDVNKPELSEGMIPIKWDDSQSKWVICSENDPEWYNYIDQASEVDGTSKWANVMLSDGKYYAQNSIGIDTTNKQIAKAGQVVEEADLGSMFVWIPRFAYSIESGYHSNAAGKIDIAFLNGTNSYNTGTEICYTSQEKLGRVQLKNESGQGNWNEHPAFTYGDVIIPGIWVAKFEASSTTTTPDEDYGGGNITNLNIKVLPGKQSWRNITIENSYINCVNMNSDINGKYYGISTNDSKIDPHLMKNSEWGAVAYLTQSSYGRNGNEVTPNSNGYDNDKYIYTGYAGDGTSATNPEDSEIAPTNVYYYNTKEGTLASTTGNITGIYDLSGGAWEEVSAYVDNGYGTLENYEQLISAPDRHKQVYEAITSTDEEATTGNDSQQKNYEKMEIIYGDAIYETSSNHTGGNSWNGDYSGCPYSNLPCLLRGGPFYQNSSGIFYFSGSNGGNSLRTSFRPTIVIY